MDKMKTSFEIILKFSIPFIAIFVTYYFFNLSDWIKPLSEIEDQKIKWSLDLAFNTSVLYITYELVKARSRPAITYDISITDRKEQDSITLDHLEAQDVLALKYKISVQRDKCIKKLETEIKLNYPKWLTLELDDLKGNNEKAFNHNKEKNELTIKPKHLFNEEIKGTASFVVNLKVLPSCLNNTQGTIQTKVNSLPRYKGCKVKSYTKDFNINILGE